MLCQGDLPQRAAPLAAVHVGQPDVCGPDLALGDAATNAQQNALGVGLHDEALPQDEVSAITVLLMEELAYMLEKFSSVDEGDGSLLDNSVILATSEVSLGQTHSIDDVPMVLAGSACGKLRTNYHYKSVSGENASMALLTLCRAMDLSAAEIGVDEGWTDESLTDIEL